MKITYILIGSIVIISLIIWFSRRVVKSRVLSYSPNILLGVLFILLILTFYKYPGGVAGVVIYGIVGLIIIALFAYAAIINIAIDLYNSRERWMKKKSIDMSDNDDAWECPKCGQLNNHNSFSCRCCGYNLI